ncbi:MAG: hypothetical protein M3015_12375 [Bacteroidota bacterium]|nr:hypothetical protein [Bacteroidota bacterium]
MNLNTTHIKEQLHSYLEVVDDKKLKAIYTMVEDEIKENIVDYSPEFQKELDSRVNYYLKGGKMVSPAEMNKRLKALRKKRS